MKVLKPGREQKGWATEATCTGEGNGGGGCHAELLVEQPDLFTTSSSCYDETTTYVTFRCSQCGVYTDIKKVPSGVQNELPTRKKWEERNPR
jgi:hypothetical protein